LKIIADTNIPFATECFSSIGNVEVLPGRDMTPDLIRDADILLVRSVTKVNSDLLADSKIRFVATATIGTNHIDTEYLQSKKIAFASAPGSNANSVAEYIIAALLSVAKKHNINLKGKSIGIIGVGNVGTLVEKKTKALGLKVYLNDPPLQRQTNDEKYLPLEELFNCDFITLHTPLTFDGIDKTYHLANRKFFDSLKTGCIFINTARGAVTDTNALKNAIKSGKLKAAVIDVWENEPNIDTELIKTVDLSTPHIAGYSLDGKIAGTIMIYNAACRHLGIEPEKTIEDFLPSPQLPQINIDLTAGDEQEILHQTVQQAYTINRDDFNTREIIMVPADERGHFFVDLRKNYPVRREFQNTQIIIADKKCRLAEKLKGIGFKV